MRRYRCERGRIAVVLYAIVFGPIAMDTALAATIGAPVQIGSIFDLAEISGVVDSRSNPNTFWVHNDSGDTARFYAISDSGDTEHTFLVDGTYRLDGVSAFDWEDIAIASKPGGGNYLYLGDIGDNELVRSLVTVYRTDEPTSKSGGVIPVGAYATARLQYPGGRRNAESMFVDPLTNELFIITKSGTPEIYNAPASAFGSGQTTVMAAQGLLGAVLRTPTAADISPDGRFILVRNRTAGYLFERAPGQSVADALHGPGVPFQVGSEPQGEAIGWAADGHSFYTTSERNGAASAPIYSYAFSAPAILVGDYNNDQRVDAADYTTWRDRLGMSMSLPNEVETLGVVTNEDFDVWRAHFGESLSGEDADTEPRGALAASIPEPATFAIFGIAALSIVGVTRPVH